ncbi:hypothetical protein [Luteimicrobium subarcticum]|uniref:Glycosyltransferase involved in cell wall biosynthesis n=1 Tax=Luteimicrobium subarcticum TaxID=620910 RepID=A0A2M8WTH4_9MICO|nr:hypothetical protein [Luteimicrobium subarcticum]PJI94252.1 hypothetical protein CLV34_1740 [Luteimicrobium subarcticum]
MTGDVVLPDGDGLVVSYCFPPYADTAGIVAAKRVRELGRRVRVLSNAMDATRAVDRGLERIAGDLVTEDVTLATPTGFATWETIEPFAVAARARAATWLDGPGAPTWMYSRAQFAASNVAAALIAADRPGLTWVAEFSDPLSADVRGRVRRSPTDPGSAVADELRALLADAGVEVADTENGYELCEAVTFLRADRVLFTNDRQRAFMTGRCHDASLRTRLDEVGVVVPHPTLDRSFYALEKPVVTLEPGPVHVAYFGNLYANRGLEDLLDAFALLAPEERRRLRFHVFTARPQDVTDAAAARGVADVVRAAPALPYLEFLALSDTMDLLVVTDADTRSQGMPVNPFLPSKVSDYLGSSARIWAVVEEGSALSELDVALRTPVGHVTAAAVALARLAAGTGAVPRR